MTRWLDGLFSFSRSEDDPWGPWPPGARVAVIAPWFAVRRGQVLSSVDIGRLRKRRPHVVAAPVPLLRRLAAAALDGLNVPTPELGFVALTGMNRPVLDEAGRNLVWRAFQVPAFQQFHGAAGQLLAWECEALAGLHIHTGRASFSLCPQKGELRMGCASGSAHWPTGLQARFVSGECACGRPEPRLAGLRPWIGAAGTALSATA